MSSEEATVDSHLFVALQNLKAAQRMMGPAAAERDAARAPFHEVLKAADHTVAAQREWRTFCDEDI